MYLGGESKVLSIENKVSAITYIETFILKLENRGINQVPNYLLKAYMGCWASPLKPIYLAHKLTPCGLISLDYRVDRAFRFIFF